MYLPPRPQAASKRGGYQRTLERLLDWLDGCLSEQAAARRGDHGRVRTMSNKEVLRVWKLAPCDVEARVRRLKCAQTLVQDPAHHTQLITAMFGKLPSEPNPTLGPGGEISPPYDERGVI